MDLNKLGEIVERGSKGLVKVKGRLPDGRISFRDEQDYMPRMASATEEELIEAYGTRLEKLAYRFGRL